MSMGFKVADSWKRNRWRARRKASSLCAFPLSFLDFSSFFSFLVFSILFFSDELFSFLSVRLIRMVVDHILKGTPILTYVL